MSGFTVGGVALPESTYYKCSDHNIVSTEQELIDIFEHKIYEFIISYN